MWIHPISSRIVAGSVLNDVHTSNDSGKTWTSSLLRSEHGVYGDPRPIADGRGSFYFRIWAMRAAPVGAVRDFWTA